MLSTLKNMTTTLATLCSPREASMNIRIKDSTIGTRKGFVAPTNDIHKIGDSFKEYKNPKDGTILSEEEYKALKDPDKKIFLMNEGQYQNIEDLINKMETLYDTTINRLHIYQKQDVEPTFTDEITGKKRPASEALMPDEKILNFVNDFCLHVSNKFTAEAVKVLQNKVKNDPEFKKKIEDLHEIHLNAYEFFENKMVDRIFSLDIDRKKGFDLMKIKKEIYEQAGLKPEEIANIKETLNPSRALTEEEAENIVQKKISILQALAYDYHLKKAADSSPKDTVSNLYESQMVENYDGVIKPEIELLTNNNLFKKEDLKNKNLLFVGAGFPLSAVLQNVRTGIKVTLVDLRKIACDNGNKILKILDILGVIKADDFNIIHKNALDLTYHQPTEENPSGTLKEDVDGDKNAKIYTDILQLAAALPKEVIQQVMTNEESDIPLVLIRESTLARLYQPVNDVEYGAFKAQQQAATYNRNEAGLIIPNIPCTAINQDQDNRTNSILYKR